MLELTIPFPVNIVPEGVLILQGLYRLVAMPH